MRKRKRTGDGFRLFKPTKGTPRWWAELRDQYERIRRLPLMTDKGESAAAAKMIVRCVENVRTVGKLTDPELLAWASRQSGHLRLLLSDAELPGRGKNKIRRGLGLIPRERIAAQKNLDGLVTEFGEWLENDGTGAPQVALVTGRVRTIINACRFERPTDIAAGAVVAAVAELRKGSEEKRAISQRTGNFYLTAVNAFCRWLVRTGALSENPLAGVSRPTVTDERKRRALSLDEQAWLIDATELAGDGGKERSLIYATALGTGFRASELGALVKRSFDLDADPPAIVLPGRATKNRRDVRQPIRPELASKLRAHLAHKLPDARAFNMPSKHHTAQMLRRDLEHAREAWINAAPDEATKAKRRESEFLLAETPDGVLDFHALRHSYGSNLARGGVPLKVCMDLMRHSDPKLTMRLYAHTVISERGNALSALPTLPRPLAEAAKRTGTDDCDVTRTNTENPLAFPLAQSGQVQATSAGAGGRAASAAPGRSSALDGMHAQ